MSGEQPKFNFGGSENAAGGAETPFNTPVFSSLGPAALQNMLAQSGFGQPDPEAFIKTLPLSVRNRVTVLRGVQLEVDAIQAKLEEEIKQLVIKYESQFAPLFDKRAKIVTGEEDVTEDQVKEAAQKVKEAEAEEGEGETGEEAAKPEEEAKEEAKEDTPVKGVPDFWLTALKNHPVLDPNVHENDVEAIKFLTNIKCTLLSGEHEGFKLEFFFAENPFFTNTVLEKVYHIKEDGGEDIIESATGSKIQWKPNKCLTERKVKKKQRHKGGKNTRVVVKTEPCESFFNFFSPPDVEAAEEDEEMAELLEADFELGQIFKESLIPRAIDYFLGIVDAFPGMDFDGFDGDEFGEEDDEDDDDDDDDDEAPRPKVTKGPAAKRGGAGAGAENPECKQQ